MVAQLWFLYTGPSLSHHPQFMIVFGIWPQFCFIRLWWWSSILKILSWHIFPRWNMAYRVVQNLGFHSHSLCSILLSVFYCILCCSQKSELLWACWRYSSLSFCYGANYFVLFFLFSFKLRQYEFRWWKCWGSFNSSRPLHSSWHRGTQSDNQR